MSLFRGENIYAPKIIGATDGSPAPAGVVGEAIVVSVAVGSPVSLTTTTAKTVATLTLTPGDWDVSANLNFTGTSATVAAGANFAGGISTTTNTLPTDGSEVQYDPTTVTTASFKSGSAIGRKIFTVSVSTPVYLVGVATFTAGTVGGYGSLTARRIR